MRFCGTIVGAIILSLAVPSIGQEIAKENHSLASSCGTRPKIGAGGCLTPKKPSAGIGGYPCSGPKIDQGPDILSWVSPEYSQQALAARYEGTAGVRMVLQTDGIGRDFKITQSLGLGLDQKAIDAVKQFTFRPASLEGHPVEVTTGVVVAFCLPNQARQ